MQAVRHYAIVFKPRTGRIEQRIGFKKVLAYYIIIGTAFYFHKSAGRIMFIFVARGDIALAEVAPDKYVLHRVLEVNDGKVILKGDGNYRGQEICPLKKVAGKVKEVQHMDGSATDPQSPMQMRRWQRWMGIPAIVRRYYLAFYRRIKRITP
jgi:hypothetical protein